MTFLAMIVSGCATYVRVYTPDTMNTTPKEDEDPKFCIVDCTLETLNKPTVFPGDTADTSTQVNGIQPAFQAANPEWFSNDSDAIPICVKIRARIGALYGFPRLCLGGLTLDVVPALSGFDFDLSTLIQLGPGEWSDSKAVEAKREVMYVNYVSLLLCPSLTASEKGWRKLNDQDDYLNGEDVLLWRELKEADATGRLGGTNPYFAKILAKEIVRTWQGLSPWEKQRVKTNPVGVKLKAELYPETKSLISSSNAGVAVPMTPLNQSGPSSDAPSVVGYGYGKSTRRGYVEFRKNGVEHLAALKWARETAIPKVAGDGAVIRIVSETTLENGNSRIDFEVMQ